jgi:hypothetical protein
LDLFGQKFDIATVWMAYGRRGIVNPWRWRVFFSRLFQMCGTDLSKYTISVFMHDTPFRFPDQQFGPDP